MSIFHPVKRFAKRAFAPFLPIAKDNCSSLTTAVAFGRGSAFSSSILTPSTWAGRKDSAMNKPGFLLYATISIFSLSTLLPN